MKKNYLFAGISLVLVAVLSIIYVFFYDNDGKNDSVLAKITGYKEEVDGVVSKVSFDDNSINFDVTFEKKEATVTYLVTISNLSDRDVTIKSINGLESSNMEEPTYVLFELSDLLEGDTIEAKKTRDFTVIVKYDKDEFIENTNKNATLRLVFE